MHEGGGSGRGGETRLMLTETVSIRDGFFCFICEIYF